MLRLPLSPVAALSLALACGDPGAATGFSSAPTTTVAGSETGEASAGTASTGSTSTSSTSTSTGTDSGGGPGGSGSSSAGVFDMGTPPDFAGNPAGCQGKVDFLFVISSSESEGFQQVQLKAAFPEFIKIIESDFNDFDYHIMVVDATGTTGRLPGCDSCYMCINCGEGCESFGGPKDYPCDLEATFCDWSPGAGVTMPRNFGASNKRCNLFGDHRYIIKGEPNLTEAFTCIATLGAGPKTSSAMGVLDKYALEPDILSEDGCNAGFLRDEALLVVVVVQRTNELWAQGPPVWWASLLEKKNGNADAIVVMVISYDNDVPGHLCPGDMEPSNLLREFTTLANGRYLSSCAPSYVPFLKEGADLILDRCALLVPQ